MRDVSAGFMPMPLSLTRNNQEPPLQLAETSMRGGAGRRHLMALLSKF
jgi:hypothetical protein